MPFLAGVVTPQDFEATGNGSTDDTAAVQAAITYVSGLGGGIVFFPEGTYLCTPTGSPAVALTVPSNVRLIGATETASVIKKNANGTLLSFTGTTSPSTGSTHVMYSSMENLELNCNGLTGTALQLYYASGLYFQNMQITSNADLTVDCVECWDSRFINTVIVSCGGSVNSTTQPNVWIRNASAASGVGASTGNSNNITFLACRFENFLTGALFVTQGTSNSSNPNNIKVIGCKFEGDAIQGGPVIQTDTSTKQIVIDDCHIQMGGFAGGYSTAQNAISFQGGESVLSNCVIGNGSTATVSNGVFLHAVGGNTLTVSNVIGNYTTGPTTGHLNFDATATGAYSITNTPTTSGTQYAGTPPTTLVSLTSLAVTKPLLLNNGTSTSASAPVLTPTFASGTAAQLSDLTQDYMVYFQIGTAGTITLAVGPANTTVNTLINAGTATGGELISFRLPAGWFAKATLTTATIANQKAIGC
jgi:hypothetical protein